MPDLFRLSGVIYGVTLLSCSTDIFKDYKTKMSPLPIQRVVHPRRKETGTNYASEFKRLGFWNLQLFVWTLPNIIASFHFLSKHSSHILLKKGGTSPTFKHVHASFQDGSALIVIVCLTHHVLLIKPLLFSVNITKEFRRWGKKLSR